MGPTNLLFVAALKDGKAWLSSFGEVVAKVSIAQPSGEEKLLPVDLLDSACDCPDCAAAKAMAEAKATSKTLYASGETVMEDMLSLLPGLTEVVKCPNGRTAKELLARDITIDNAHRYCLNHRGKVSELVVHLNDAIKWTREEVADWLDTLDVDLTFPTERPTTQVFYDTEANWSSFMYFIGPSDAGYAVRVIAEDRLRDETEDSRLDVPAGTSAVLQKYGVEVVACRNGVCYITSNYDGPLKLSISIENLDPAVPPPAQPPAPF